MIELLDARKVGNNPGHERGHAFTSSGKGEIDGISFLLALLKHVAESFQEQAGVAPAICIAKGQQFGAQPMVLWEKLFYEIVSEIDISGIWMQDSYPVNVESLLS